jgi:hypothetical protein
MSLFPPGSIKLKLIALIHTCFSGMRTRTEADFNAEDAEDAEVKGIAEISRSDITADFLLSLCGLCVLGV